MLFNSVSFFVFLGVVYLLYRLLGHRQQNWLLLVASYVFYGWWDVRFLFLIVVSTVVDYSCGLFMDQGAIEKKNRLIASSWLVSSALMFVVIDWGAIAFPSQGLSLQWIQSVTSRSGWMILVAAIVTVFVANVAYHRVAGLEEAKRRKLLIISSVVVNLGILAVFKYFNFFIENIEGAIQSLGSDPARFRLNIILPVGISFYTFQTMSYTIDIYRGSLRATSRFSDLALFVAFFPQLVAGPVERAARLLPQMISPRQLSVEQTLRGLHLIVYGLFKKIAIADGVARTVDSIYSSSGVVTWIDVIVGTVLFAVQIYCDFSGYSDIARGTAKLLGFDLMVNFREPYFSRNPREFWGRWHISLSSWLRDYLYVPIGGNRIGTARTYMNLSLTMLLGGLWHGAAWNFVLWGAYQGVLLCGHRAWVSVRGRLPDMPFKVPAFVSIILFFALTCYGWLLFRAPSMDTIIEFSSILVADFGNLSFGGVTPNASVFAGLPVLCAVELSEAIGKASFYNILPRPIWTGVYACLIVGLVMGSINDSVQFIYFVF